MAVPLLLAIRKYANFIFVVGSKPPHENPENPKPLTEQEKCKRGGIFAQALRTAGGYPALPRGASTLRVGDVSGGGIRVHCKRGGVSVQATTALSLQGGGVLGQALRVRPEA